MSGMSDPVDRALLREAGREVQRLVPVARRVLEHRTRTEDAAQVAAGPLTARTTPVRPDGPLRWQVLPLEPADRSRLGDLAAAAGLPGTGV